MIRIGGGTGAKGGRDGGARIVKKRVFGRSSRGHTAVGGDRAGKEADDAIEIGGGVLKGMMEGTTLLMAASMIEGTTLLMAALVAPARVRQQAHKQAAVLERRQACERAPVPVRQQACKRAVLVLGQEVHRVEVEAVHKRRRTNPQTMTKMKMQIVRNNSADSSVTNALSQSRLNRMRNMTPFKYCS